MAVLNVVPNFSISRVVNRPTVQNASKRITVHRPAFYREARSRALPSVLALEHKTTTEKVRNVSGPTFVSNRAGADPGFSNGGTGRAPKARVSRRRLHYVL